MENEMIFEEFSQRREFDWDLWSFWNLLVSNWSIFSFVHSSRWNTLLQHWSLFTLRLCGKNETSVVSDSSFLLNYVMIKSHLCFWKNAAWKLKGTRSIWVGRKVRGRNFVKGLCPGAGFVWVWVDVRMKFEWSLPLVWSNLRQVSFRSLQDVLVGNWFVVRFYRSPQMLIK